jgi:MSHA pilin protein MshC
MKIMFPIPYKKHGFTLVELVLTLVILGILAAVSLPKFFSPSTFDARFFHDDLVSAARYAQRLAIGSGCAVRLSVSSTGFTLVQDNNCNLSSPSYTLSVPRPSDSESFSNTDVPTGLSIVSTETAYYFMPKSGVVDVSGASVGNATIVLSISGVITRTIRIVGATGYVDAN